MLFQWQFRCSKEMIPLCSRSFVLLKGSRCNISNMGLQIERTHKTYTLLSVACQRKSSCWDHKTSGGFSSFDKSRTLNKSTINAYRNGSVVSTCLSGYSCNFSTSTYNVDVPVVVMNFPYMRYLRIFSRIKIYQTALTVLLAAGLSRGYIGGDIPLHYAVYGTFGMTVATSALIFYSYFIMKFIGEIQLQESSREVKFSTLDFFGRRRDMIVPLDAIISIETDPINTPQQMNALYSKLGYLDNNNKEAALYYCPRWSKFPDNKKFAVLLGKGLPST